MIRARRLALLPWAAGWLLPVAAQAQSQAMLAYPAMQEAGAQYAIQAEDGKTITRCDRATGEPDASLDAAACAKLTARGLPAGIEPARSLTDPRNWVTLDDYPRLALQRGESGMVEYLIEIGVDGRVRDCIARIPSGSKSIDWAVCHAIKSRARFSPATYRGKAVPAVQVGRAGMWIP